MVGHELPQQVEKLGLDEPQGKGHMTPLQQPLALALGHQAPEKRPRTN